MYLLFQCSTASYVWSLVANVVGADCKPSSLEQFLVWCKKYLLHGKQFYAPSLAAICYALWRARNNACFERKTYEIPY